MSSQKSHSCQEMKLMRANNSKAALKIFGYIRQYEVKHKAVVPLEIQEMIRVYSWPLSSESVKYITATHWLANIIRVFFNNSKYQCKHSNISNYNDINILHHIYIYGDALRDCYYPNSIQDINIVIDVYSLSKKYLHHLQQFHSNDMQQQLQHNQLRNKIHSNCIVWNDWIRRKEDYLISNNSMMTFDKNFIIGVVRKNYIFNDDIIRSNVFYGNISLQNIKLDITDLDRYSSFNHHWVSTDIKNSCSKKTQQLSVYDNILECDFTVNAMHINLKNILAHNNFIYRAYKNNIKVNMLIDYNWEYKILLQHKYMDNTDNNETLVKFNNTQIQDLK